MRDGRNLCIAATGVMVEKALRAAEILKTHGIEAAVLNVHTIKPFDQETICLSLIHI